MAKATRYSPELIEEYTRKGLWDSTRLCDLWDRNALLYPDAEAIVDSKTRLSWSEANRCIDRLALGLLELGFKKDDVLAVQLPNIAELALLRVACEKTSIICLPVLRTLRQTEVEYMLKAVWARGFVILREFAGFDYYGMAKKVSANLPHLEFILVAGQQVPADAISVKEMLQRPTEKSYPPGYLDDKKCPATEFALVLHTTGTTGFPKFVEHPVCRSLPQVKTNAELFNLTAHDVFAILSPAASGPNHIAYFGAPYLGARVAMLEKFEPEDALKLIQKERVTVACVVPTMLAMMVNHQNRDNYDCSSVRYWWSAGAPINYKIAEQVEEDMGGLVINIIGAQEWGGECYSRPEAPRQVRLLTVGRPQAGLEIKLVDEDGHELPKGEVGEIWGRGPTGLSGCFQDPEATWQKWTADGWYRTGDLGRLDEQGNLVFVDRKDDLIVRGGQNIYPAEVEKLLHTHPKVSEVALVGYPDALMGQRSCAYVVPKPGQTFSFEEMVFFLKQKSIASFKLPERLEIIDKIPMVGEQKVDKKLLKRDIREKLKTEGKLEG